MTILRINQIIAKHCGWKFIVYDIGWYKAGDFEFKAKIPDYCNDLNAIHKAEKTLKDPIQQSYYVYYLGDFNSFEKGEYPTFRFVNSTAKQRAVAFLKTIGKWE